MILSSGLKSVVCVFVCVFVCVCVCLRVLARMCVLEYVHGMHHATCLLKVHFSGHLKQDMRIKIFVFECY